MNKVQLIRLVAILGLGAVGIVVFLIAKRPSTSMLIDNTTNTEVTAYIDGKSVGKVAAHKYIKVGGKEGKHKVELKDSSGTVVDSREINVVEAKKAFEKFCYVYNVQGKGEYAVYTAVYHSKTSTSSLTDRAIDPAKGSNFFKVEALDGGCEIDKAFPKTKSVGRGMQTTSETHLCHVSITGTKQVDFACPGAQSTN